MGAYGQTTSTMSQGGVPGGGVVKLMRQMPSVECKFFDTNIAVNGVKQTWTQIDNLNVLAGIVQGTGASQRVGRKIKVVGIVIRYDFFYGVGSVCFDLIRDKQCNGIVATATQIYSQPTSYGGLPNPFEESRFQFLKRTELRNPAQALTNQAGTPVITNGSISFVKKVAFTVEYNASTGLVTDLTSDNIMLYVNSTDFTTTGAGVVKNGVGTFRILYTDA